MPSNHANPRPPRPGFFPALFSVCALTGATPASAEDAYARLQREDNTRLAACFDGGPEEDRRARLACIDVVNDACQKRPSISGNYVAECLLSEATAWEALMHREYAGLQSDLLQREDATPKRAESAADMLTQAQEAWRVYQMAECGGYAYTKWGDGSMRFIDSALCYRDLYAARAVFLWQERQPMPWPGAVGWAGR